MQDPGGEYVAQWVPELRGLPKKYLHKPWDAPAEALQAAGVELGKTYPHRIETQKLEVSSLAVSIPATDAASFESMLSR